MIVFVLLFPVQSMADGNKPSEVLVTFRHELKGSEPSRFTLYQLTEKQYDELASQEPMLNFEEARRVVVEEDLPVYGVYEMTGEDVKFSLKTHEENDDEPVHYLMLQEQSELDEQNQEYVVLPILISSSLLSEAHPVLETKAVSKEGSIYFYKFGRDLQDREKRSLSGAVFTLYRYNQQKEKEYLVTTEPVTFRKALPTKDKVVEVISDEEGLVKLSPKTIEPGTYYFEELKAPTGYRLTEESKKIEVIIPSKENGRMITPIRVKNEPLYESLARQLPSSVTEEKRPRIWNKEIPHSKVDGDRHKEPPKKNEPNQPGESNTPNKPKGNHRTGYLPQTGEAIVAISGLGFILMGIAVVLLRKGEKND